MRWSRADPQNVVNLVNNQNLQPNGLEQANYGELHVDCAGAKHLIDAKRVQDLGEQLTFTGFPAIWIDNTCCRSMPLRGSRRGG